MEKNVGLGYLSMCMHIFQELLLTNAHEQSSWLRVAPLLSTIIKNNSLNSIIMPSERKIFAQKVVLLQVRDINASE